ncbi:MAG: hypothetical protein GXO65_01990 [Euryarchaeota archaeon]|nr:hypothetical protein [Euryarchaeota archaeon]
MRVYLDLCAWNRPFDSWEVQKVKDEAHAVIALLERPDITIIGSRFAMRMIEEISWDIKYEHVSSLMNEYVKEIVKEEAVMLHQADMLQAKCRLKKLEDALHLVIACHGDAEYFVTTDQELINKNRCIKEQLQKLGFALNIANPMELV